MEEVKKYNKIGGWLFLVIFGWVVSLVRYFSFMFDIYKMYEDGIFEVLRDINSDYYNPNLVPLIELEFIVYLICVIAIIYGLVLMFKKKKSYPNYAIGFIILVQLFSVIDLILGSTVGVKITSESVGQVVGSIFGAIIWISYFKKSVRVKQTFIN